MFLAAVVVILFAIFILNFNKKEFYKLKRNLEFAISLPGASIFSSFVSSMQVACDCKELVTYIDTVTKKYGNLTRFVLGTEVFIILAKPDDYKLVLTNVNGTYKTSVTKTWESLIGDGIIRTSGATHKLRRKIIQPLLNLKYLSEYITFFDTYSSLIMNNLEGHVNGPIFDLKPYIARYTFDIFFGTMVDIQGPTHNHGYNKLMYWHEKLFEDSYNRMVKPWLQYEWILSLTKSRKQMRIAQKNMLDFVSSISPQKGVNHNDLQDNNGTFPKSKSVFNNYWKRVEELRNKDSSKSCEVSDENFIDDIRSFFNAIQNTITELTSFIMLILAIDTKVQEKLREEISATFSKNTVDAQGLLNMRYLYMVYQETLRLFPISPFIPRQLTGDIKLESCTLPEGCYVIIPIFNIHRNPEYWDKPLEFIPERFSSESSSNRHRYTYIPFGTGLRDCLGQRYAFLSAATIIVNLVRRYRFVNTNKIDDIEIKSDLILRTRNVRVSISPV